MLAVISLYRAETEFVVDDGKGSCCLLLKDRVHIFFFGVFVVFDFFLIFQSLEHYTHSSLTMKLVVWSGGLKSLGALISSTLR